MNNLRKALEIVQPVSKFIPAAGQYLEPSLKGLMKLLEMTEQAKSNRKALKSLADQATMLSMTIVDKLKDLPKDRYEQKMEPLLKALFNSINETKTYFEQRQTSTPSKSKFKKAGTYIKNVWRSPEDKEALEKLKHEIDDSIKQFLVLAELDGLLRLEDIGELLTKITRWMDDFVILERLKTVHNALHTSGDAPVMCAEGTSTLLLDELEAWAASRDARRIYWLSGHAGTGKSTVARTLCDRLAASEATKSLFIISFFVSRRYEADRRDPLCIVHTLSYYLARALPDFRAELLSRLEAPDLLIRDISAQVNELIAEPLKRCASDQHRTVVIVIDAFDECNADDEPQERKRRSFLRSLLAIIKNSALQIRLLFVSRWMSFIDDAFEEYRLYGPQIRTANTVPFLYEHKIDLSLLHGDIKIYLDREFRDLAKERKRDDWPAPNDVDKVVERANGLFIYAATVVRYVRDGFDPKANLDIITSPGSSSSSSPDYAALDDMYGVVLTTASSSTVGPRSFQQKAAFVQLVLGALSVSQQPLTVTALAKLLGSGTSNREVDAVIGHLASVLRVESEHIYFYHSTFLDYLLDESRCTDARFRVDPTNAHRTLATGCFLIMNASWKKNDLIGLDDPSTLVAEVADLGSRIADAFSVPLIYACKYWCDHLKQSQPTTSGELVYTPLGTFCTTQLLRWIEASSLLGNLTGSERLIMSAAECCQALSNILAETNGQALAENLARIAAILRDAGRLMSTFHDHIATRPLQVYVCAALFLPDGALLDAVSGSIDDEFKPAQPVVRAAAWGPLFMHLDLHKAVATYRSMASLATVSPDGSRVITAVCSDNEPSRDSLHIRDTLSGASLMNLEIENEYVRPMVTFSSRGDYVAILVIYPTSVLVWDLERNTSVSYHYDLPGMERSIAFSSDDCYLSILSVSFLTRISVISNTDGMRLGDARQIPLGDPLPVVQIGRGRFGHISWCSFCGSHAAGGDYAAIADATTVNIYQDASCIATFQFDTEVTALEFAPLSHHHGLRLAVGNWDGSVVVWSQKDKRPIHTFHHPASHDGRHRSVCSLAFYSHDAMELLASASWAIDDRCVRVWSLNIGGCIWSHHHDGLSDVSVVFIPPMPSHDPHLLLFTDKGTLEGWNVFSAAPEIFMFSYIEFSPDNRFLAIVSYNAVHVQEIQTGDLQPLLSNISDTPPECKWSTCDRHGPVLHLRYETDNSTLHLMRAPTGEWFPHQGQSGCHETWTGHGRGRSSNLVWDQKGRFLRYRTAKGDWHNFCPLPPDMHPAEEYRWPSRGLHRWLRLSDDAQFLAIGQEYGNVTVLKLKDELARELRYSAVESSEDPEVST